MSNLKLQEKHWRKALQEVLDNIPASTENELTRQELQKAIAAKSILETAKKLGAVLTRNSGVWKKTGSRRLHGNYNDRFVGPIVSIQNLPQALYHLGTAPPEKRTDYPALLPILEQVMSEYISGVKHILVEEVKEGDYAEDPQFWMSFCLEAMHLAKAFQIYQEKSSLHMQGTTLPKPGFLQSEQELEAIGSLFHAYLARDSAAVIKAVDPLLSNSNISPMWRPVLEFIKEFYSKAS
jgi:hypothetical protein